MDKRQLQVIFNFYARYTLSFSAIGYHFRKLFWQESTKDLSGKRVLVTGASGGIGSDVVVGSIAKGATVLAAARNQEKLNTLRDTLPSDQQERMVDVLGDLSLQRDINTMLDELEKSGEKIDVLVNNVGLIIHELTITDEEFEASFTTNLLNHYILTTELLKRNLLSEEAVIVNVSSGGMYNAALVPRAMNNMGPSYNGTVAYTLHKRGQVALNQYWREKYKDTKMNFYVMHPGWVDTPLVKATLQTFRKIMHLVLRDEKQGADTIHWLACEAPPQQGFDQIWLDRKARRTHHNEHTRNNSSTINDLISFLDSKIL